MAEVVDFVSQRATAAQEQMDYRARGVTIALAEIAEENNRGEVRSLVALVVDYQGKVHTTLSREFEDDVLFLGALEIFKSDLLAKLRERREFVDQEGPGEPND